MIYARKSVVGGDLIGFDTDLSVIGAFQIVENGVTELMAKLKIDGITAKKLYNAMWVYTKNRIKRIKPVHWGEEYTVESFITGFSLVKLNIETAIRNSKGEIAVYSKTELCALDLETGRIRKTSTVGVDDKIEKEQSLMEVAFTKFGDTAFSQAERAIVRSTNIDFCRHTNNVEYVRFMLNTYSVEELEKRPIREIEVCYVNQSFENDELQICKSSDHERDILKIKKEDKTVVDCEILREA
ncbi:MAG: acyl-ACP thioesterase [Clostridia bacterium]|nr:acyl-ACP thioesterase [Clostridia bacterium]